MKKQNLFKKLSFFAAALAAFFVITAAPAGAYANASKTPTAVSVTYYDGVYTRGFTWRTDRDVTDGQVWILEKTGGMPESITNSDALWNSPSVIKVTLAAGDVFYSDHLPSTGTSTEYGVICTDDSLYRVWKANYDFTAAAAGKTFFYKVGSPTEVNGWSPVGRQKIDGGSDGVKLVYVTDPQGAWESDFNIYKRTLEKAYEKLPGAQAVICAGDLMELGYMDLWNMAVNVPQGLLMDTVFMPSVGNHDVYAPYFFEAHFNINYPKPQDVAMGMYYSFDIQNVHIAVLETASAYNYGNGISTAQLAWLENDLKNSGAKWKIVAMHMPLVSAGNYVSRSEVVNLRTQLFPVFAKHKVDLVLQGHDHTYARSKPYSFDNYPLASLSNLKVSSGYETETAGGKEYMVDPNGTTYILMNTAGVKRYSVNASMPSYLSFATSPVNGQAMRTQPDAAMFGAITINDTSLMLESYTVDYNSGAAELYDYFGIIKYAENGGPADPWRIAPAPLTITAPAAGKKPSYAITGAGESFTASLSWLNNPDTFKAGEEYTAVITLEAAAGFNFNGYTDTEAIAGFKVNGVAPEYLANIGDAKLRFTVTFTAVEKQGGCGGASPSAVLAGAAALFCVVFLLKFTKNI